MDKALLRKEFFSLRDSFDSEYKSVSDRLIFEALTSSDDYLNADEIFIYVSVKNEVNTSDIIQQAFKDGKKVAVPHCRNKTMDFYYIGSTDELVCLQFGVPTVDYEASSLAIPTDKTLCIVPALSFDKNGNRLGYGGGYYDRYLASHRVNTLGLCREKSIADSLPADEFDIIIENVITEKSLKRRRFNNGEYK